MSGETRVDREALRRRILQDEADAVDPERRPHPDIKAAWIAGVDTALDAVLAFLPAPHPQDDTLREALTALCDRAEAEPAGMGTVWISSLRALLAAAPAPTE